MSISDADKERLYAVVEGKWLDFQDRLSDGGKRYPIREFKNFVEAVRNYIAFTGKDPLVHRNVVNLVNGLTDNLQSGRKQVPGEVLAEADRLECLFFADYDPYFEGDEPRAL